MEEYYKKLGEYINLFAICESYINQLIVFTNDLNDLNRGYRIVEKKIFSLDKRLSVLRHQVGKNDTIKNKRRIYDILDKVEIDKDFRNNIVHGIIGVDVSNNELMILPLIQLDTGKLVKRTDISNKIFNDYIKKIRTYNTELKVVINILRLRRLGVQKKL